MSATFFSAATACASWSSTAAIAGGASSSSCSFFAAAMSGSWPLSARRISMPGISRRLISLVPSKMRFTRASR